MFLRLRGSKLISGIIHVASGNSIAQLVILIASPIITRIYSPETFGVQGVFLAAISLLAPMAALRFPMAIVVASDETEVKKLIQLSFTTALVQSSILLIILFLFRHQVSRLLGLDEIGFLIYFLPLALCMTAIQEISNYLASREQRFRSISRVSALQALGVNLTRILGGLVAPSANVLVTVSSFAPGIHAAMLSSKNIKNLKLRKPNKSDLTTIKNTAKKYREFPIFRTPTDFLNSASQTAPVILLSFFFSPVIAGLYTLTRSTMTMPSNIIGNAIGTVFYSDFAERVRKGQPLVGIATKATLALFFGPGTIIIIVAYFGPTIFEIFFGAEWKEAGVYASWLSIATATSIAQVPAVRLAPVIKRQGILLLVNVFLFVSRAGSILFVGFSGESALTAVISYSITSSIGSLLLILTFLWLTRIDDFKSRQYSTLST